MIKSICWDVGGVLLNYSDNYFISHLASRSGKSEESVKSTVYPLIVKMEAGALRSEDFSKQISKELGVKKREARMTSFFSQAAKPNTDLILLARQLRKSNYEQSLLSNIEIETYIALSKMMDLSLFEPKILSVYIKMRKPDRQIFDYALKKIKRSGEEIVFIDDRKANVEGARAAGMNSILFDGISQLKEDLLKLGVKGF